jgi:phasin
MASASKKKAARTSPTPVKSQLAKTAPASRAPSVSPRGSAKHAETSPPAAATDDFVTAAPLAAVQHSARVTFEKGVTESRPVFAQTKTSAEETVSAFEVGFTAAKDGALAFNAKAFEALRANADANFDFLKAVFAAKTLSDVVTLQSEFGRKRVETTVSQANDLSALAQKAMADSVEPITKQVAKSFKIAV